MKQTYSIDNSSFRDFYEVLGVSANAGFTGIKKAYYRRAKECHPDINPGKSGCESEFKLLVHAFDILSDPVKRYLYDEHLRMAELSHTQQVSGLAFTYDQRPGDTVMDTIADDILEELIVGNYVPDNATLQTLMRDLERTEIFMRFREAKNLFAEARFREALRLFKLSTEEAPQNILYHFYLGQTAEQLGKWSLADKEYQICLKIGATRNPQQYLQTVRDRLYRIRQNHRGFLGTMKNFFSDRPRGSNLTPEEQMVEDTSRVLYKMMASRKKQERFKLNDRKRSERKRLK